MPFLRPASFACIEPLESRIAPALLINGANLLGGAGNPHSGQTSIGGNEVTLVTVAAGQAVVWFEDGFITGISFGPNTALDIHGDVFGDIIGNLTASGRLSDSNAATIGAIDGEDGNVLLANNLIGLKTSPLSNQKGTVFDVITGGSVSNVSISGKIFGIYAGDGVFRSESALLFGGVVSSGIGDLDINPVDPNVTSTFVFTRATSQFAAGASVKTATIQSANELQIFAGNGDADAVAATVAGKAGGSVEGITIASAFIDPTSSGTSPSYFIHAGDGEAGKTGGAGGAVLRIIEKTSNGTVKIVGGKGGAGSGGIGGAGGSVSALDMQSDSSNYLITAGDGGTGIGGGAGGSVTNNSFANRTPTNSILIARDFTGDGLDDVLAIDSGSGQMVLSESSSDGSTFAKVIQTFDPVSGDPIVTIAAHGTTPIDAIATDFDGDGDLDIIVAYKNTANLGVYLNDGDGGFFDPLANAGAGGPSGFEAALGFTPALLSLDGGGGSLAVISSDAGESIVHRVVRSGLLEYSTLVQVTKLGRLATDLVLSPSGALYAGSQDGSILQLTGNGSEELPPYTIVATGQKIAGGIANLDASRDGTQLLALNGTGNALGVYGIGLDGVLTAAAAPNIASLAGRSVVAHFVKDSAPGGDSIAVLSVLAVGSEIDLFDALPADNDPLTIDVAYAAPKTLMAQPTLKNFVVANAETPAGYAAVGGSLSQFFYSRTLNDLTGYALPFVGKKVTIEGGDGGFGLDAGTALGKGGAGGNIVGLNANAIEISVTAGDAGGSTKGAGGAGGSVSNPLTFLSATGALVAPTLLAEERLEITVGDGGTPTVGGTAAAAGGSGGSISGLTLMLATGEVRLFSGDGGDGLGGAGGGGGSVVNVIATAFDGNLTVGTGSGGDAKSGIAKAGDGGAVTNFKYTLQLNEEVEKHEASYFVAMTTGGGGVSAGGLGGAGGALTNVSLSLDGSDETFTDSTKTPPTVHAIKDSTVYIGLATGAGGVGAIGGSGGAISGFSSVSFFDQLLSNGAINLNYVVAKITSGAGGKGNTGLGGNGGAIGFAPAGLAGITSYDPEAATPADNPALTALRVIAGDGADGGTKGGNGGSVGALLAKNALFIGKEPLTHTHLDSAEIKSGKGGAGGTLDGGKGGDVFGATVGVEDGRLPINGIIPPGGGRLIVTTGAGGAGGGKGGAGGGLHDSIFATVNRDMALTSGTGGAGVKGGGIGGLIGKLQINTPQRTLGLSAVILAGDGGAATAAGAIGGVGGDIVSITQAKDINSSINLIEAGNGGASTTGAGGRGGNVTTIKTVGFIGKPSGPSVRLGAFDENGNVQGLYSGRGGVASGGGIVGIAGSVAGVNARQIAAIAAAVGSGGLFLAASKVSGVKADVIGYDVDGAAAAAADFDNVLGTSGTSAGPTMVKPIDGFILAKVLSSVTGGRPPFLFIG